MPYSLLGGTGLPPEAVVAPEPKDAELGIALSSGHQVSFTVPGKITVPARKVVDPSGKVLAETDPVEIEVKGLELGEKPKPESLYGPISFAFPRVWLYTGGALALLLLAYAIYALKRWSEKRRLELARVPEAPKALYRVILARLDAARNGSDFREGKYKRVAYEYSESLKMFLSGTFQIPAEESTTHELIQLLEAHGQAPVAADTGKIFSVLDLVKFTDYSASEAELETLYRDACKFVLALKKEEVLDAPR